MHYFLKASLHTSAGVGVHADRWAVTGVCAPDRGGRGQPVQNTPKGNAPFMSDGQKYGTGGICISSLDFCFSAWMVKEGEIPKPLPDGRALGFSGQISPSKELFTPLPHPGQQLQRLWLTPTGSASCHEHPWPSRMPSSL